MPGTDTAKRCYVGLGSNLDNPVEQIQTALQELAALAATSCTQVSSLYYSSPMGPANQPDFVNAVAELITQMPANELLKELLRIEIGHGRVRASNEGQKNGPRTLDLDLLTYADLQLNEPGLTLPHPGLHQRDFVILPLLEIAPTLTIPGLGSLVTLQRQCIGYGARRGKRPT